MKHIFKTILTIAITAFITGSSYAQVATNSGSGLAATYPDLATAITALNGATITSPVVITLTGNETAPAGGYSITAIGTAANTITIQGSASTITASGALVAGNLNDAIFKLLGADYISIKNFIMLENAANTTTAAGTNNMTEWGVALLYATTTNGSQHDSIIGNTITLNRTYANTFGIYSNSTHAVGTIATSATATTATGGNSFLVIQSNTISNVNEGITVVGPTAAADHNDGLDIGGSSLLTANSITNYGTTSAISGYANVSGTVNGILVRNTKNFNISYNTITSSVGGTTAGTLRGIFVPSFSNAPTGTIVNTINNNNISVQSGAAGSTILGIENQATTVNATTTLNINTNNFSNFGHTVAATGAITFINNAGVVDVLNVNNNTFTNISVNTSGNVSFIVMTYTSASGTGTKTVNNNSIVTAFNKSVANGNVLCVSDNGSSVTGTLTTVQNNNFSNITVSGTSAITGINLTDGGTAPTKNITGNTLSNWTAAAGAINAVNITYWNGVSTLSNNIISNLTGQTNVTGITMGNTVGTATSITTSSNTISGLSSTGTGGTVTGITCSNTSTGIQILNNTINGLSSTAAVAVNGIIVSGANATGTMVAKNKIYDLTTNNASGTTNGILVSAGQVTLANNIIGDLKAPIANSVSDAIRGISITSTTTTTAVNVYYNTVGLNATSSGANFNASCLFHTTSATATTAALDMRNNIFINNSTPNGTGTAAAYRRSSTTLTNFVNTSDRNDFSASTIFADGTNFDVTLAAYKARVVAIPADVNSISQVPNFLSTVGANANFLHIDPSIASTIESGAANIVTYTNDFDGNIRQGNGGYVGTGTAPDMGADEFETAVIVCSSASGGTISPATVTKCETQTVSMSSTGATTGTGITYQWKVATVSGGPYTNVTGGTGATTTSYTSGALVAGTFYYVLETTCSAGPITGLSNELTVTVNATPVVSINPSSGTYCTPGGSAVSLTASGAASFTWSPAGGLSATTGATVTASPAANTTYTVTGTTAGCSSTATATVNVSVMPVISSLTASPLSVCNGANSTLTALAAPTAFTYCTSTHSSGCSGDDITHVTLGSINNATSGCGGATNQTTFAPTPTTTTTLTPAGGPYSLSVSFGTDGTQFFGAWIDYNQNGIFETTEFLGASTNAGASGTIAVSFSVPAGAYNGVTKMRIVGGNDVAVTSAQACGASSSNFGETQNYDVTISGATAQYSYTWSPSTFLSATTGASVVATAMTASTAYTVTALSVGGCSVISTPLNVTEVDLSAPITGVNISCNGANDGTFVLGTVGCGTAPFTYSVDGGAFGAIPTNLAPGAHGVVVKDNAGLTTPVQNILLTQPAAVPVPVSAGNKSVCANAPSVFVKANSMQTVVVPFNVAAQPVETNAAPGNIVATANIPANLGTVTSATITYNGINALGGSWQSDVRLGFSGAIVDAEVAGTGSGNVAGIFNYTRTISPGNVNIAGGTVNLLYWDYFSDNAGDESTFPIGTAVATLTITYNPAPTITWYDAATAGTQVGAGDSIQAVGTAVLPNTATPNVYNFYAQANYGGCPSPSRTLVTVTVKALPSVSYTATPNDTVCVGTQITLAGTGATSYTWNNSVVNNTAFTPTTQNYTVTGLGANGCSNTAVVPVKVNALPLVTTAVAPNDSVCATTPVTLNGVGAVSYTWNNSVTNNSAFTPSTTQTYTVTGIDANGCSNTATQTVTVSSGLTASASSSAILCNGGSSSVVVSATGGIAPYTGAGTFTHAAGSYSYIVTDVVGCTSTASGTISEPTALTASSSVSTSILCNGGSGVVTVVAAGGTTPYTGDGAQTATAGAYNYTVTDANGCTTSTSGTVNEPAPFVGSYTATPILCHGGTSTITVSATGGTSPYSGPGTYPGVPAGTYPGNILTDDNGCTDTLDLVVTQPTAVVPNITSSTILCNGDSSTVTVIGTGGTAPYTGEVVVMKAAGTYSYTVTDANACTGTASVTISQPSAFTATTATTAILCNGGTSTITVTANGGVTPYSGEVVETQLAGTYNYTLTDDNGCVANASVTVTEPTALSASSSVTTPINCGGGTGVITVVATGGTTPYSGDGAMNTTAGTQTYTVTDDNGCTTSTTTSITEPAALVASATTTTILCNGGTSTVVVSATGAQGPTTGEGTFTANAGSYLYTVTDSVGCTNDATGSISEPTALVVNITSSTIMCYGDSSTIVVSGSGATAPYAGELTENQIAGTYSYTLTDDNGCAATQSVTIAEPSQNVTNQTVAICPGGMVMVGTSMYMSAGTFADTLVSAAGCDSIVNTTVNVTAGVVTTVTVNNETITADEVGATYQWVDCDNAYAPISGETAQSFTATTNGNFAVIVSANGCTSDTSVCTPILTVGVKATVNTNLFSVYPNPNNGAFTISTSVAGVYNIVNELGQVVESLKLSNSNIYNVNLNVANGVYYVVGYNSNNDVVKQKIVVLK